MVIGRDHIASMTNTLLLAYVGASLPLFLLLASLTIPLGRTFNREFIAEEIVRYLGRQPGEDPGGAGHWPTRRPGGART